MITGIVHVSLVYWIARWLVLVETAGDLTVDSVVACGAKGRRSRGVKLRAGSEHVCERMCVFVVQTSDSIESQPFSTSHLFIVFDWFCLFICVVSQELFLVSLSLLLYSHFTLLCSLIKPFLAHFQKVPCVCLPERTRWRLLIRGHRYLSPSPV